jgi:hypothetical protein
MCGDRCSICSFLSIFTNTCVASLTKFPKTINRQQNSRLSCRTRGRRSRSIAIQVTEQNIVARNTFDDQCIAGDDLKTGCRSGQYHDKRQRNEDRKEVGMP